MPIWEYVKGQLAFTLWDHVSQRATHTTPGEIKVASAALDFPSEREIARQERMKREG